MKIIKLNEVSSEVKAKRLFISPGSMSDIKTFAIFTPENPDAISLTSKENELKRKNLKSAISYNSDEYDKKYNRNIDKEDELQNILRTRHFYYYKVKGKYGNVEHSFIVYNISLEDAKQTNAVAHQQSFIFGTNRDGKLHFEFWANRSKTSYNYIKIDERDTYIDATDFEDYYTQISNDFKFNIPFEVFNVSTDKMIEFYNRKKQNNDYALDLEENINDCLNDKFTFKGRELARMKLYSNKFYY